jgi:hypothetical protein
LDFFAATSSSKGVGDNGGVIGMSSSALVDNILRLAFIEFMGVRERSTATFY